MLSWDGSAPPSGRTETCSTVAAAGRAVRVTAVGAHELEVRVTESEIPGLVLIEATAARPADRLPCRLRAEWRVPCLGATAYWTPATGARWLPPSWRAPRTASLPQGAPVGSLVGRSDRALCTFALGEFVLPVSIGEGVVEETGEFSWWAEHEGTALRLLLDLTERQFSETLTGVTDWWASLCPPVEVPDAAFDPVFCTWYARHLAITSAEVERLAELAAPLGFGSLIVDDGWQTDETGRSYATAGDWQPAPLSFPDFAEHVKRVQALGLRYLLWHALPFAGERSRSAAELSGHALARLPQLETCVLDPRSPTVRARQTDRLAAAVERYGVNGLKVDFIDTFARHDDTASPEADCPTVAEGVGKLLAELDSRLRAVDPGVLVEHRQDYTGPGLWRYASMVRATDCPHNAVENRARTVDLRLAAGPLAVHADPLTWHPDETPEQIAVLLQSVLFATPQVSVDLAVQRPGQLAALRFWLSVMRVHRDLLQRGALRAYRPELAYPLVESARGARRAVGRYGPLPVPADGDWELLLVANADPDSRVRLAFGRPPGSLSVLVQDCLGGTLAEAVLRVESPELAVEVPCGGLLTVRR